MRSSAGATLREACPPVEGATKIFGWTRDRRPPTKAIVFPSCDQRGLESSSSWAEILVSAPPAAETTQTSVLRLSSKALPVRSETKAIERPSGDQRGSESFQSSPEVTCRAAPL